MIACYDCSEAWLRISCANLKSLMWVDLYNTHQNLLVSHCIWWWLTWSCWWMMWYACTIITYIYMCISLAYLTIQHYHHLCIGQGWFETVYSAPDIRIHNQRVNIVVLILQSAKYTLEVHGFLAPPLFYTQPVTLVNTVSCPHMSTGIRRPLSDYGPRWAVSL